MTLPALSQFSAAPWARAVHGVTSLLSRLPQLRKRADQRLSEGGGPYLLGEKLGAGGMGVVYEARHTRHDGPLAIKLLPRSLASSENIRRFEREAEVTRRLSHPNTVQVYDVGRTEEGLPYYTMEYVDGLDLQALVEREGPLPPARAACLLAQLAGALSEVHAAGLIHGDIKPANAMWSAGDRVKLLDFGLARAVGEPPKEDRDGFAAIAGTPLYLAPEAITAPESVDARSDLYALGALGYFLVTGAPPFGGKTWVELCAHHVHSAPVPPSLRLESALPGELEALLLACLDKSPERRPSSAALLQARLRRLARNRSCPCDRLELAA